MRIEDQVCSKEQAEKIMNLTGFALETGWYWFIGDEERKNKPVLLHKSDVDDELKIGHSFDCWLFPAPTVAELGVLLEKIPLDLDIFHSRGTKSQGRFYTWIEDTLKDDIIFEPFRETEAQARAEALIWLLENGYLKPEDLKL